MQDGHAHAALFDEWNRVMEVAGELIEQTDDYPRRYVVRKFPNSAALEAIGPGKLERSVR